MDKTAAVSKIIDCGVIAIIRARNSAGLLPAAAAIVAGGVEVIEFTLNTPDALPLITAAREKLGDRVLVGAGTVLNAAGTVQALQAGAQFIVMPGLDRGAVEAAQEGGVPVIPGGFTPTEVMTAWNWGADLVKLFPASVGGPGYFKSILSPLSDIRLVATGGVSAENAGAFVKAGAVVVGVGGSLVDRNAIQRGEFDRLTEAAANLLEVVQQARR